jgi:hypothetical protein
MCNCSSILPEQACKNTLPLHVQLCEVMIMFSTRACAW